VAATPGGGSSLPALTTVPGAGGGGGYGNGNVTTSPTSVTVGTGVQSFVTAASGNPTIVPGHTLTIWETSAPANFMIGTVTTYSGTALQMNITSVGGSGAHADWSIAADGGNGGNGNQGGGAGGGGSVLNGATPGTGGTGGNGYLMTIESFA
jgi:hypothetical protein